jgi:hypothetical protein
MAAAKYTKPPSADFGHRASQGAFYTDEGALLGTASIRTTKLTPSQRPASGQWKVKSTRSPPDNL